MRALQVVAIGALIAVGLVARALIQQVNPPIPATDSSLGSIACPAAETCIAVGLTGSKYTVRVPLTAHSAGGSWSVEALPGTSPAGDSFLGAVVCASTTHCVAVGSEEVPAPYLGARSSGDRPMTQLWDGTTWSSQSGVVPPGTADAELRGVDCVQTVCMAVGSYARRLGEDRPLAESWDGDRWTLHVPPGVRSRDEPAEGVLSDVACVSAASCVAVGRYTYDLAVLTGIGPLIQRWDGTRWRIEPSATPAGSFDTELTGVSCPSEDRCVAVGFQRRGPGIYAPFSEIWDGRTWSSLPAARPAGSPDTELVDVACPRPDRCVAVGSSATGGNLRPLIETWDGESWRVVPLEPPSDFSASTLSSVDCSSPTSCHAVGTYSEDTPILHAYSVTLSDGHPAILPVPDP